MCSHTHTHTHTHIYIYYAGQDPMFEIASNLTDDCGKVDSLNMHAAILVPFYYLPLLILTLLILKLMGGKVYVKLLGR